MDKKEKDSEKEINPTVNSSIQLVCAVIVNFYKHYSKFENILSHNDNEALHPSNSYLSAKEIHNSIVSQVSSSEEEVTNVLEKLAEGWLVGKKTIDGQARYAWVIKIGKGEPFHFG